MNLLFSKLQDRSDQNSTQEGTEGYVCQVLYQRLPGFNNLKFVFTILPKEHLRVSIIAKSCDLNNGKSFFDVRIFLVCTENICIVLVLHMYCTGIAYVLYVLNFN